MSINKRYGVDVSVKTRVGRTSAMSTIRVGGFSSKESAENWASQIKQIGNGQLTSSPKIVKLTSGATPANLNRPPEAVGFVNNIPKHIADALVQPLPPKTPVATRQIDTNQTIGQPQQQTAAD